MARKENSSWKTDAWNCTCTVRLPAPVARVNEPSHKFHSSQVLMSYHSLSITLTGGAHLSRPGNQTMTLNQAICRITGSTTGGVIFEHIFATCSLCQG